LVESWPDEVFSAFTNTSAREVLKRSSRREIQRNDALQWFKSLKLAEEA
jgi:hypothetical protein